MDEIERDLDHMTREELAALCRRQVTIIRRFWNVVTEMNKFMTSIAERFTKVGIDFGVELNDIIREMAGQVPGCDPQTKQ